MLENTWITTNVVCSEENTGFSQYPNIAIDGSGCVHIIWQDSSDLYEAGGDYDIFYRKLVGPPQVPTLASFSSNPTTIGNISVDWNNAIGADNYLIYRENSYIWSTEGLTPLQTVSSNHFIDNINITGTYYYVIVAENDYGVSDHSNVESIVVIDKEQEIGFFQSLRIGEILVLAGIIGGFQVILTLATYFIIKITTSSKKKK